MEFIVSPLILGAIGFTGLIVSKKYRSRKKKEIKKKIYIVIDELANEINNELTPFSIEKRTRFYIELYSLDKDLDRFSRGWNFYYSDNKIRKYLVNNYNYPKGTGFIMYSLIEWIGFKYGTPEYINLERKIDECKYDRLN